MTPRIICSEEGALGALGWQASVWNIMSKVRVEAMMWGAGTALGELPPYFMARAARLSGYDPDDEDDLREFEELQLKKNRPDTMVSSRGACGNARCSLGHLKEAIETGIISYRTEEFGKLPPPARRLGRKV